MPKSVDKKIKKVMRTGKSKSSAIRILKSSGAIRQKGKHLAEGKKR